MAKFIIMLIALAGLCLPAGSSSAAADCHADHPLVVTSPHAGAMTFSKTIAVRGFLCDAYQLVMIRNKTTSKSAVGDTVKTCDGKDCVYSFRVLMGDLIWGVNQLEVLVPDQDPPVSYDIEVTRTALTMNP